MAATRTLRKLCQHTQRQVCKLHTSSSRWAPTTAPKPGLNVGFSLYRHAESKQLLVDIDAWLTCTYLLLLFAVELRWIDRLSEQKSDLSTSKCYLCPHAPHWCAPSVMPVTLHWSVGWWNRCADLQICQGSGLDWRLGVGLSAAHEMYMRK